MTNLSRRAAMAALGLVLAGMPAVPALAEGGHDHMHVDADTIVIHDPYVRASGMMARAGAAFMGLENVGEEDDRLIGARTDAARSTQLHTHVMEDGIAKMRRVADGFPIPAGKVHWLARGGDHIMLMGLTRPLRDGDTITLTLVFEKAGEVTVEVPVDNDRGPGGMEMRKEMQGGGMHHGQEEGGSGN